jgi:endoribonuclease Dicer
LDDFVYIKKTLGLWSAERAALLLIIKIDKLKTREKYERHYLLLSVLYTEMVKVRKICEAAFEELSELEKLMQYSTPKMLRLVQVLRQYKPEHVNRASKSNAAKGGLFSLYIFNRVGHCVLEWILRENFKPLQN